MGLSSLVDVHKIPPIAISSSTQACKHQIKSEIPQFDEYRPYFGWVNVDTIKEPLSTLHNGEPQLRPSPSKVISSPGILPLMSP